MVFLVRSISGRRPAGAFTKSRRFCNRGDLHRQGAAGKASAPPNLSDLMRYLYLHGFGSSPDSQKARFFAEQFAALGRRIECPRLVPGPFSEMTLSGQLEVIRAAAGYGT